MNNSRSRLLLLAMLLGASVVPTMAKADILFRYGMCNPSDGCDQSLGFSGGPTGTSITGNTNPPHPLYDITATSSTSLHGSGSTIDTGPGGAGFTDLTFTPEGGYAWGAFEFQMGSTNKNQPLHTLGLTLSAVNQSGLVYTFSGLEFPWEGNRGENQHYTLYTSGSDVISQVIVTYQDPLCSPTAGCTPNTIQDIHNIDFNTRQIPEPSSAALLAAVAAGAGFAALRKPRGQ